MGEESLVDVLYKLGELLLIGVGRINGLQIYIAASLVEKVAEVPNNTHRIDRLRGIETIGSDLAPSFCDMSKEKKEKIIQYDRAKMFPGSHECSHFNKMFGRNCIRPAYKQSRDGGYWCDTCYIIYSGDVDVTKLELYSEESRRQLKEFFG